jgi:hypothetical protein
MGRKGRKETLLSTSYQHSKKPQKKVNNKEAKRQIKI